MNIIDNSLEKTLEQLCSNNTNELPFDNSKHTYFARYMEMAEKLNREFHDHVLAGSSAIDGGILTDHGPDHIKTVIQRASILLNNPNNRYRLYGYEIYLLLCAIHFHDLGNINGREKHEKRVVSMMEYVKDYLGDAIEKDMIRQIASAHGGEINGDPDTISYLSPTEPLNGIDVRPRMLAAILRFSDEIADDHHRANKALQRLGAIPKQSEIFHKYASSLHSVMVRDDCQSIELSYSISLDDIQNKFPKLNKNTKRYRSEYIVDEILSRLFKMYNERTYCNRFMSPIVNIRSISVRIRASKYSKEIGEKLPEISFRLEEAGYPSGHADGIYALSNDLGRKLIN
ncbi:HD domain-containing protein [Martelella limonii]|uniref:HD domain-containing protein n=1 Tax=Martelella limonii TaxID=1647649 RepID=UPI0015804893|nr:hypothetical protein [Martelella limonii]